MGSEDDESMHLQLLQHAVTELAPNQTIHQELKSISTGCMVSEPMVSDGRALGGDPWQINT
jgi:hypothetical protein